MYGVLQGKGLPEKKRKLERLEIFERAQNVYRFDRMGMIYDFVFLFMKMLENGEKYILLLTRWSFWFPFPIHAFNRFVRQVDPKALNAAYF